MKRWRQIYCLAVLAAALVALLSIWRDFYSTTWQGTELQTEHLYPVDTSLIAEETLLDPGPFAETEPVSLVPGSYRAIVRYHALGAENQLAVYYSDGLGAEDDKGTVIASTGLDPQLGETVLPFSIAHRGGKLQLQVIYGGDSLSLHNISIVKDGLYYTDRLLLTLFVLLLGAGGYRWLFGKRRADEALVDKAMVQARLNRAAPVLLVVFVGVLASLNCFANTMPIGHDLEFHLVRIDSIAEGWRNGQFPVRVHPVPMNGKGYLQGAMYPDLFLWPAALLRLLGVSLIGSYQFLLALVNLATSLIAYYAGRELFHSKWNGALTSILYTLAYYRMHNAVERAALGETIAMAFFPLLAVGLYHILVGNSRRWPLAAVAASGIIQSHVLSVLMAGLFSLLFVLCFIRRLFSEKGRVPALLKMVGVTLLANAWFLVPFLYFSLGFSGTLGIIDAGFSAGAQSVPAMLTSGFLHDDSPYGPGVLLVAGLLFFVVVLLFFRDRVAEPHKQYLKIGAASLGFSLVAFLLCSNIVPWSYVDRLPLVGRLFSSMQFPWRFLSIATVAMVLCVVSALAALPPRRYRMQALAAILLCAALPAVLIINQTATRSRSDTVSRTSEIEINNIYAGQYLYQGSDIGVLLESDMQIKNSALGTKGFTISDYTKRGTTLEFSYQAEPGTDSLVVPLVWYAGYRAVDENGSRLAVAPQRDGLVQVTLPASQGTVRVWYAGEWFFRLGDAISLTTLALALLYIWRGRAGGWGGAGSARRCRETR